MNKEIELQPFLPTSDQIDEMSLARFEAWMYEASEEIPKRAEKRDPLFHLKKRISTILEKSGLSEAQREACVLHEIMRFKRITQEPQ